MIPMSSKAKAMKEAMVRCMCHLFHGFSNLVLSSLSSKDERFSNTVLSNSSLKGTFLNMVTNPIPTKKSTAAIRKDQNVSGCAFLCKKAFTDSNTTGEKNTIKKLGLIIALFIA